jgi:hypothetical protein
MRFITIQKLVLITLFAFLSFISQPILAGQIETYSSWDESSNYYPWGTDGTQTYGEILTPDSNISLTDFSYYLKKKSGNQIYFQAYVYAWDDIGHKTSGTALFSSDVMSSPASDSSYTKVTISTGNIHLAANNKYVLFFTSSGIVQTTNGTYHFGRLQLNNPMTKFAYYNNGNYGADFGLLSTHAWEAYALPDTAYIINYYTGPSAVDTQSSMQYQSRQLRSAFNTQTVAANFALNYDCNIFDVKGMCISAGGRYTTIDNPGINNSAAVVTLGYKVNSNIRIDLVT